VITGVIDSIICSEFDHKFGRSGSKGALSDPTDAMILTFGLSPFYDEEQGYRHLHLLLYGGGGNYISVYGKLDWNVIAHEDVLDDGTTKAEYTQGDTGWVLLCHHDSCWRGAVHDIVWEYRDRINYLNTLFRIGFAHPDSPHFERAQHQGWYTRLTLTEEEQGRLREIRKSTPGYGGEGRRLRLDEQEFRFKAE